MNQPIVSVVMPTFNRAEFIGESIGSVLSQTFKNFELIIIDNYSKDSTEEIVDSFHDTRIKYCKFIPDSTQGIIGATRNYAMRQAGGQYIAFIDSDDIWFRDKLRLQLNDIEKDFNIGLVFCTFKVKSSDKRDNEKILGPKDKTINGFVYDKLLNFDFIVLSSVLIRASVIDHVGYFDDAPVLKPAEDFDLWLRIAKNYKIFFSPEVQGIYRIHASNINVDSQRLQKALLVINKHFVYNWTTKRKADRAKANFYFREGWFLIDENVRTARFYFIKALMLNFRNLTILYLCLIGLIFSIFPFRYIYYLIRKQNLDTKFGNFILNPQHL